MRRRIEQTFIFLIALAVLSPLQFHLDWYTPHRGTDMTAWVAMHDVMKTGALFFLAVPLAVVTFFEIRDHDIFEQNPIAKYLAWACWIPVAALVFEGLAVYFGARQPDGQYIFVQAGAAILAIFIAVTVKYLLYGIQQVANGGP